MIFMGRGEGEEERGILRDVFSGDLGRGSRSRIITVMNVYERVKASLLGSREWNGGSRKIWGGSGIL